MKLTDKKEMSKWAFEQCLGGNNSEEIRSLVTLDMWIYLYCMIKREKELVEDKNEIT